MAFELSDRVALITGASGGIGRACAVEFHRAGCRVVAAARNLEKLEALAGELGDRILPLRMDVTRAADRESALRETRERFGPIDVLVNNAGWASFGTVLRTPETHWRQMFETNLFSGVALIQAVLPEMLERRSGQIVNISSVVGTQVIPRMTLYSATKAALNALSTGLRMELRGSGVDVIRIAPSSTRTEFFDSAAMVDTKAVRFAETQYSPERVARAVVRACRRRTREMTLSTEAKAICLIRRLSHRLADAIMNRVAERAMPRADLQGRTPGRGVP